ncbi:hypothetical protein [Kitasatospora griseola]
MASKDVELGRATAVVAERIVGELSGANQLMRGLGLGELPDHAINGGVLLSAIPHEVLGGVNVRAANTLAAQWRLWARAKNVVAMHPDMAAELATYKLGILPGALFRNLGRHPNSIVAFAEPPLVELPGDEGGPGRLLAITFCGRTGQDKLMCLTSDPRMSEVAATAICEPLTEDGSPLPPLPGETTSALDFIHLTIPAGAEDRCTVEDLALRLARRAGMKEPTGPQRAMVLRVLQVAVYLCSTTADIQVPASKADTDTPVPRGKAAKPGKQRRWSKPENFLRAGWRLGPKLKAARAQAKAATAARRSGQGTGEGGGRRQYPHQRCGHLKTIWYGPGRSLSDSRLIAPYWVSQDLLDADGQAPEGVIRPAR